MKLHLVALVCLLLVLPLDARHRMKGGKQHSRQKRTIGDIINWKLNLLQSIFGGITGLFGGGKKPQGGRPSYGAPQRPQRPARPSRPGRPQRPSYSGGPRPQGRPQGRPAAQRPGYNQGGQGGQVFGPASVFHMLPAPNLATEAPQGSAGLAAGGLDTFGSPGAPATQDSYGAPAPALDTYRQPKFQPLPAATSGDSYGAPTASAIASSPSDTDDYGAPTANVIASSPSETDDYGAPASAPINTYGGVQPATIPYQAPAPQASGQAAAPVIDTYGGAQAAAPVIDSYGGAQQPAPVIQTFGGVQPASAQPAAPATDTYGGAPTPLVQDLPIIADNSVLDTNSPVISDNSVLTDYDEYDPNDVPADQAAPAPLPSYSQPAEPVITDNSAPQQEVDTYGGEPRIIGTTVATSAPVPDEAFTVDSQAPSSFDSYGGDTLSEPIDAENEVIVDLTQKLEVEEEEPVAVITDNSEPEEEAVSAEVVDLRTDGPASVLPPVEHLTDVDYNKVNDITLELINEEAVEAATTASPVLFTYAPDTEGPDYEEFQTPVNTIVLQSGEEDGSLSDPLNVIPDDYLYDEYDPNDIPADQARPEELVTYEEQPTYGPDPATEPLSPAHTESSAPLPAFDANLRETIEFSTAGPIDPVPDIAITTYSPEIDFDLGTTSSEGIEVVNLVTAVEEDPAEYLDDALAGSNYIEESAPLYDDEYEDTITSYQPDNVDIPIVVEEASPVTVDLPSYDPVVLLVGTPEKKGERSARLQATHIPLFSEEELEEKKTAKRNSKKGKKKKNGLKERYNNWFGARNDWSKRIQRVQGRIRYKNSNKRT